MKQSRQCTGPSHKNTFFFPASSPLARLKLSWVQLWFGPAQTPAPVGWVGARPAESGDAEPQRGWSSDQWRRDILTKPTWKTERSQISRFKKHHITTGSSKNRTIFLITTVMNIIKRFFLIKSMLICVNTIYIFSLRKVNYEAPLYIVMTLIIWYAWLIINRAQKDLCKSPK